MTFEFVDESTFTRFFNAHKETIYQDDFAFSLKDILSPEEKEKRSQNAGKLKDMERYHLFAKKDGEVIGWSFGIQKGADDFFMRNSAVFPAHRRSGVYSAMLERSVQYLSDRGFQRIYSLHKMANNPILIAKLKFGFVLTGFRISDRNGCMAELTYFTNEKRKALYEVRVGSRKLDGEMSQYLV